MARGELLKKLFATYNRGDQFRAVAIQIIHEEEKKKNLILANSLRKSLEAASSRSNTEKTGNGAGSHSEPLRLLPQERDKRAALLLLANPTRRRSELVLSRENERLLAGVVEEFRRADAIRRHGLAVRSKLLFCGPPGCGKSLCAEVFAREVGLPLLIVSFDVLVSSYLGETSGNLRKVFDYAAEQPVVIFFDEFDAIARARDDESEHGELKRVVNALLQLIDRYNGNGFVLAATNYQGRLDAAICRRFDEVVYFDKPTLPEIRTLLSVKLKNFPAEFAPDSKAERLNGFTHAEIERVCLNAVKQTILRDRKRVSNATFDRAIEVEKRRRAVVKELSEGAEHPST